MSLGFIILRHVRDDTSSKFWKLSLDSLKTHYPECPVLIVDDHSDYKYINPEDEKGVNIIRSELEPGRGEFLPYYYYLKNRIADRVCFIHDSVFINKRVDLTTEKCTMLWDFNSLICLRTTFGGEILLLSEIIREDEFKLFYLNREDEFKLFYLNREKWRGCFGCMTVISYEYLDYIFNKYSLEKLKNMINCRIDRECFERILGCN